MAIAVLLPLGAAIVGQPSPSSADVTAVSGSACGYFSNVSLFGGPSMLLGCGQAASAAATASSPSVVLPPTGGNLSDSKPEGATAQYGPAKLFSGQYPNLANDPSQSQTSPPSGPLSVSTMGTTGPNGSVTSSASVAPGMQGTTDPNQPRGVGPGPIVADAVSSTCTASETNSTTGAVSLTGSTTITNGIVVTTTDANGAPATTVPVPTNPAPNTMFSGTINNVGDSFSVVYNEQVMDAPGSITVNAIHMKLLGPTAVGDLVIGQSHCDLTTVAGTTSTTGGSTTSTTGGSTTSTTGATTSTTGATTSTTGATTSTTRATTSTTGATTSTTGATTSTTRATTTTTGATTTTIGPSTTSSTTVSGLPPFLQNLVCSILSRIAANPFLRPFLSGLAAGLGCAV